MPRRAFHSSRPFFSLSPTRLLFSDAGNGVSGGGGASGSPASGTATPGLPGDGTTQPALIGFDSFAQSMDRFTTELGSKFDALRGDVGQLPDRMRPEPPPPAAPDYDSMTQSELATHLTGSITQQVIGALERLLGEKLAPVVERVNDVQQSTFRDKITSERDALASTHKDFLDFKAEMVELAKAHPTLGLKALYNLARSDHPDKAKALDAKYNPPAPPPPKWGGLTPAFGASADTPKLSREDASKEAYREVAARHPGILAALESM